VTTIHEKLQAYLARRKPPMIRLPPITCVDGFRMSVQVSAHHYCTPRSDTGPWEEVEVGFPSIPEPLLFQYVENVVGGSDYTDSVYPYTPVEVVAAVIEAHGDFSDKCSPA